MWMIASGTDYSFDKLFKTCHHDFFCPHKDLNHEEHHCQETLYCDPSWILWLRAVETMFSLVYDDPVSVQPEMLHGDDKCGFKLFSHWCSGSSLDCLKLFDFISLGFSEEDRYMWNEGQTVYVDEADTLLGLNKFCQITRGLLICSETDLRVVIKKSWDVAQFFFFFTLDSKRYKVVDKS